MLMHIPFITVIGIIRYANRQIFFNQQYSEELPFVEKRPVGKIAKGERMATTQGGDVEGNKGRVIPPLRVQ